MMCWSRDELVSYLEMLLVAQQRLNEADAQGHEPFERSEEDTTTQPSSYHPVKDSELCNYEDDIIEENAQDYRDYVSGCVPSDAMAFAGPAEQNQNDQGPDEEGDPSSEPFYNVDWLHDTEPEMFDFNQLDGVSGDEPHYWERPVYDQDYDDPLGQRPQFWHFHLTEGDDASVADDDHGDTLLHLGPYDDVDDGEVSEDIPVYEEESHGGGGFGSVPASAAAIKGLKKQKYDGSSGADGSRCVICMRDYKKGKRVLVMPCQYMHRFHRKCLKKWLSRSHLCPLCRYALPTEKEEQQDVQVSARV